MAASSSAGDIVDDGFKDIAKRYNLDAVLVEAPGRVRFQKVWLWTASNGNLSTTNYDPAQHGPDKGTPLLLLPDNDEKVPAQNTREFLEVGLVYADDPKKALPKGAAGNKARNAKKKDKEPIRRQNEFIRVFTPVTEYIQESNKVYVGCQPIAGRLNHYLCSAECVFFYPEFYEEFSEDTPQKEFGRKVLRNTRVAAAINKTAQRSTAAIITPDELSKKLTAHPLVVTQPEHLSSFLRLQWDLYEQTKDTDFVKAMIASLEQAHPDLKYGPDTSTDGITNFMSFEEPLADDKAETLCHELKSNYSHFDPDVMLIKMIHARLCKTHPRLSPDRALGNNLPISGFGFFMECMHKRMYGQDNDGGGEYNEQTVAFEIYRALDDTETYMHHANSSWTPSNVDLGDGGKVKAGDLFVFLTSMRKVLHKVIRFSDESMEDVAKQHGGILKTTSFKDLMTKVGESVDKSSLQARFEQICALHAAAYAQNNVNSAKILQDMLRCVDRVLLITEKSLREEGEDGKDKDGDAQMGGDGD